MVWLDLPDAVYRGYEGDDQLLGEPRDGDAPPVDLLRREIARLEPQRVYLPLAVGGHVDHRLTRDAGTALLHDARRWVMPGPEYVGRVALLRGLPVRVVGRLHADRGAARRRDPRTCPRASR